MQSNNYLSLFLVFKTSLYWLGRELRISWLFIKSDLNTTIIPALIFMLVATSTLTEPLDLNVLTMFLLGLVYFTLSIYQFNLSNQIYGIEEDCVNKPFRPIPSGLVTLESARVRWFISIFCFALSGWCLNVLLWAILWVITSIYLNCTDANKSWLTKNFMPMGIGTFTQLAAAWEIITPPTSIVWYWIIYMSIWVAITATTQDFRDIEGDDLNQRQTLPIVFGDNNSRRIMSFVWILMAGMTCIVLHQILGEITLKSISINTILIFIHLYIANRLLVQKTVHEDDRTYQIHSYLYCLMLFCGFFVLGSVDGNNFLGW